MIKFMPLSFRTIAVKLCMCTVCSLMVIAFPSRSFAESPLPGQAQPGHADVIPGVIVFFGVVLGIILVCRSAGRSSEMKLEELDEE
jgi:hypothetical protein